MDAKPGLLIDRRFRLVRKLGAGGMGEVWVAHQASLDRDVALKILTGHDTTRFQREARAVSKVRHDNVVVVYDTGTCADTQFHFIAMELLDGESLRCRLLNERKLAEKEAVDITRQVVAGLAAAHARGIIHRDIKPENIMLTGARAKLLDFGIARKVERGETLTRAGAIMGTPGYVAPEVAMGDGPPDPKSDLYAVGLVMFEMMAGAPPFDGPTAVAITSKHVHEPAPRLSKKARVSADIDDVVARLLDKDPKKRPTAAKLLALLGAPEKRAVPRPTAVVKPAFESEWFVVDVDHTKRFVRITRTEQRCEIKDIDQAFGIIGTQPQGIDVSQYVALLDMRAAKPRTEKEFEAKAAVHIHRLDAFHRSAILVRSTTAQLQVARSARNAGREGTRIFQSEADALRYLGPGETTEALPLPTIKQTRS